MSLRGSRESPGVNATKDARGLIAVSSRDSCARHLLQAVHEKAPEESRPRSDSTRTTLASSSPTPTPPPPSLPVTSAVQPRTLPRAHERGRRLKTNLVANRGHKPDSRPLSQTESPPPPRWGVRRSSHVASRAS